MGTHRVARVVLKEGEHTHMTQQCSHLDQIRDVTPSSNGCEDCLKMGHEPGLGKPGLAAGLTTLR